MVQINIIDHLIDQHGNNYVPKMEYPLKLSKGKGWSGRVVGWYPLEQEPHLGSTALAHSAA